MRWRTQCEVSWTEPRVTPPSEREAAECKEAGKRGGRGWTKSPAKAAGPGPKSRKGEPRNRPTLSGKSAAEAAAAVGVSRAYVEELHRVEL